MNNVCCMREKRLNEREADKIAYECMEWVL